MASLAEGRTKVVEKGHTLVLGTNESTPRLVTQPALMRRRARMDTTSHADAEL